MVNNDIKAKCRNCAREVPSSQLKLHNGMGMVVCQMCYTGKTEKLRAKEKVTEKEKSSKPAGWDTEDDYLDNYWKYKEKQATPKLSKVPGTDQVQCTCMHCNYTFKFNPFKKQPRSCPYCNKDIPKLDTFSLL